PRVRSRPRSAPLAPTRRAGCRWPPSRPCLPPRVGRCPAWPGPRPPLARPPRRPPVPSSRPGPRTPRPESQHPRPPSRSERQGGRGCRTRRSLAMITIIDREAATETAAANEIITRRRRIGLPGRVTDRDRARLRALIELCRRGALTRSDLDERLDRIAEGLS